MSPVTATELPDPGIDPPYADMATRPLPQSINAIVLSQTVRVIATGLVALCLTLAICAHCAHRCMESARRSAWHMRSAYEKYEYRSLEQSRRLLNARRTGWS